MVQIIGCCLDFEMWALHSKLVTYIYNIDGVNFQSMLTLCLKKKNSKSAWYLMMLLILMKMVLADCFVYWLPSFKEFTFVFRIAICTPFNFSFTDAICLLLFTKVHTFPLFKGFKHIVLKPYCNCPHSALKVIRQTKL